MSPLNFIIGIIGFAISVVWVGVVADALFNAMASS